MIPPPIIDFWLFFFWALVAVLGALFLIALAIIVGREVAFWLFPRLRDAFNDHP